jgi:hypothetical protein
MRPPGTKSEYFKSGSWSESELFYMINHVATLTGVYGSFKKAVEEMSRRLGRKNDDIVKTFKREQSKNRHRAG